MSVLGMLNFVIILFFLPKDRVVAEKKDAPGIPFTVLIKYNFIKAVLVIAAVMTLMLAVFMSFVPSLGAKIHLDTDHIGMILSLGIFCAGILQVPGGRLSDRLSRGGKMFQVSLGSSISMLALLTLPLCPDFHALLISGAFVGIGAGFSTPALMSLSVGIGQKAGMGSWMGIINASQSIGFLSAPLLAGIIMDHMGIDMVFYIFALVALTGVLTYLHYVIKRLRGHKT